MSTSSGEITNATIGSAAGYPNLNVASIPQDIRDGNSQAKQAYAEGLAFESVLVNELSQQMASTMYGGQGADGGGDSSDGGGGGGSSSGGGLLSAASAYSTLIPQTLTSSIMDSGGLGMAAQFAQEIDPSIATGADAQAPATGSGAQASAQAASGSEPQVGS